MGFNDRVQAAAEANPHEPPVNPAADAQVRQLVMAEIAKWFRSMGLPQAAVAYHGYTSRHHHYSSSLGPPETRVKGIRANWQIEGYKYEFQAEAMYLRGCMLTRSFVIIDIQGRPWPAMSLEQIGRALAWDKEHSNRNQ